MMTNRNKNSYTIPRTLIRDARGWFLKVIDGHEPGNRFPGEVYFTSAKPGETRGGPYHKLTNEWFTLISGKAVLKLTDTDSNESTAMDLDGDHPRTVFVPRGVAHAFVNCGDCDFLVVAFTDAAYQPEDTIPFEF